MNTKFTKIFTLMFVVEDNRVLLGFKKRGFGSGKYNGFGGKVELNESIYQAALRETQEECGIVPIDPVLQGLINIEYDCEPKIFKIFIFKSSKYEGNLIETDEMNPEWFEIDQLPYKNMWIDDPYWMPHLLGNRFFIGTLCFEGYDRLIKENVNVLEQFQVIEEMNKEDNQNNIIIKI